MEDKIPAAKVITVMTLGMDSRKQAVFRMAFRMYNAQRYQLLEDAAGASPDIAVIDWDSADAGSLWSVFRSRFPHLPAVAVTVLPTDQAPLPAVGKPVRMETLFPLLRRVLSGEKAPLPAASAPVPQDAAKVPETPKAADTVPLATVKPDGATSLATAAQAAAPALARAPEPAQQERAFPASIDRFDPRSGLLGALREIRHRRTPSLVTIADEEALVALPGQDSVLLSQNMAAIRRACDTPGIAVAVRPLTPQDPPPRAASPYGFTALLWQTSLWTSRGRLMEGVQAETPIRLRHWPNLTRLAPTPEAMRIAALWVRLPIDLRLTVRMLDVEPQSVFDFLAASDSIGILEIRESGAEAVVPAPQPLATAAGKERGGLLSRLLRKIVRL